MLGTAAPANAYSVPVGPGISCSGGVLNIVGSFVVGSQPSPEVVYSIFEVWRWDGNQWIGPEYSDWERLDVTATRGAQNQWYPTAPSQSFWAYYEWFAQWNPAQNEWEYQRLLSTYTGVPGFGNDYWAYCP